MANRNLIHQIDISDLENDLDLDASFTDEISKWIGTDTTVYETNKIVEGKVREIRGEDVVIDIGYKSEGVVKIDFAHPRPMNVWGPFRASQARCAIISLEDADRFIADLRGRIAREAAS